MPGPWEKYAKGQPQAQEAEGPWAKYQTEQQPEEPGLGQKIAEGALATAKKIDSWTGAPTRRAISEAQDGGGFTGALKGFYEQFNADPLTAPTGKQIAVKAGVPDRDYKFKGREPAPNDPDFHRYMNDPLFREQYLKTGKGSEYTFNPAADVGVGVELGADWANIVPVGKLAQGVGKVAEVAVKAGAGGARRVLPRVANAADAVGNFASSVGKGTVQSVFGVDRKAIDNYIARHSVLKDKVGAAEMMEEVAGRMDVGLNPIRAKLKAAEEAVMAARLAKAENTAELAVKVQEARQELKRAQDFALGEAASRVASHVKQLDEGVREGSAKAFQILDDEGVRVPIVKLKGDMTKGIEALEARAVTDEQAAVVDLLKRYRDRLDVFGKEIPGGEAKRLLQSLDNEIKRVAPGEIGRMSKQDQALGTLRRRIDAPLKESEAYAAQMRPVAEDTRLLMQTKDLASESAAARALQAAQKATGKDRRVLLQQLGGRFGTDYVSSVRPGALPETHKLRGVLSQQRAVKRGENVRAAESSLETLRGEVGNAAQIGDSGVAGIKDRISAFVRSTNPKDVQTENLLRAGDLAGVKLADELKDIKTIAAFEKGFARGSSNPNFWGALIAGTLGSAFGPAGALAGLGGGAMFGKMAIDSFGPAIGRKILDAAPMLNKLDAATWIRSLDVPADVRLKLATDLAAYKQITRAARTGAAASKPMASGEAGLRRVADREQDQDRKPAKGEAAWMQQGANKLGLTPDEMRAAMNTKYGKGFLVEASGLPANSPALKKIKEQIKKGGAR